MLDDQSLLIKRESAEAYLEASKPAADVPQPSAEGGTAQGGGEPQSGGTAQPTATDQASVGAAGSSPKKKRFYGNTQIAPIQAKMKFADIVDEIVEQFTSKTGVNVSISVEIQASSSEGFDENIQRSVKENCSVLKIDPAEFVDE